MRICVDKAYRMCNKMGYISIFLLIQGYDPSFQRVVALPKGGKLDIGQSRKPDTHSNSRPGVAHKYISRKETL